MTISKRISGATIIATANPTVTDDKTKGHYVGERWLNGTSEFVCTDPATGAAVWTAAGGGGGGAVSSVTAGDGSIAIGGTGVNPTVKVAATAVTAGSYTNTNLTVGADGRITAASNGSGGGGSVDFNAAYDTAVLAETGLVSYYPMDEASGNFLDRKGSNDLLNTNLSYKAPNPIPGADGGSAHGVSGASPYAACASPTGFPTGASAWSVECWAQLFGALTDTYLTYFGTISARQCALLVLGYSGTPNNLAMATGAGDDLTVGGYPCSDTNWHHYVGTYDGSTTITMFMDGRQIATHTLSAAMNITLDATGFGVGKVTGVSGKISGCIAKVAVYTAALTPTKVLAHYNTAKLGYAP